jgi:WD40 repeat protein
VSGDVVDIAFSPPNVAVATVAGEIWLLDGETGETRALLRGHRGRVSSVEFGPGARWLVSGSWDQSLRIWDLEDLDRPAPELVARGRENWGLELEDVLGGH